jgi:metal-responsive CopG/Arc/MetJ family transcriptional regulator
MRTRQTLTISLPPGMLKEAERLAHEENRTMSELMREALRRSQEQRRWGELNAYGRARARALGTTEQDVVPLVKEYRKEQRQRAARKRPRQ